jgi:hypothetical protein
MSESEEERSKEEKGMGTLHGSRSISESEFSVEEQERSLEVDAFFEEFCDRSAILDAEQLLRVKEVVKSRLSKTKASEHYKGLSGNQDAMKLWVLEPPFSGKMPFNCWKLYYGKWK